MNELRKQEILDQILIDLATMNIGPGENIPVKTIWVRYTERGNTKGDELTETLQWACDRQYMTFTPGGIAGLGTIKLTDSGYEKSRAS